MKVLYIQQNYYGESGAETYSKQGHEVFWAPTGQEAFSLLSFHRDMDAMIVDPDVPDMPRLELFEGLRRLSPRSKLIVSAKTGSPETRITDTMRQSFNIQNAFTWDTTAWFCLLGKLIDGKPAEWYDLKHNRPPLRV